MPRFLRDLPRRTLLVVMLVGWALIAASSLAYFDSESLPPFVIEKLPVRFETLWLVSLRIHVAAACVTLPLCLLLSTRWLQRRVAAHRWVGRFTGIAVLVALVPTGVILAIDAKGGAPVTAGFLVSAAIVTYFMIGGVVAARRRRLAQHRRAMNHVVAQMSVAVTSRALILAFDAAGLDPDLAYVVGLWGPVLLSAAIVEAPLFLSLSQPFVARIAGFIKRTDRESSPLALVSRIRPRLRSVARLGR